MNHNAVARLLDQAEADFRVEAAEIETMADPSRRSDETGDINTSGQHPADIASDTVEREIALGLLGDANEVLVEIADARRRLEAGTFGVCDTCGRRIDPERLAAVPWARRCATDENHRESSWPVRQAAMPGPRVVGPVERNPNHVGEDSTWDPEDDHPEVPIEESAVHELRAPRYP